MKTCGYCNHNTDDDDAKFCPKCGNSFSQDTPPSEFSQKLQAEKNPKKKYELIREVLVYHPDDFEANEALLYLGRLYEPMRGKDIDFSIIKCHLFCVFNEPEKLKPGVLEEKYSELLDGEQLRRTMALAPDAHVFFADYLHRLAREYIDLFIRGDSRYASSGFGFPRSAASLARKCAESVRRMLANIEADERITERQRGILSDAVKTGYTSVFPGHSLDADE